MSYSFFKRYLDGYVQHCHPTNKKWTKYYLVLAGNILFIFRDEKTLKTGLIGTLKIERNTLVTNRPITKKEKQCILELTTKSERYAEEKVNLFKFKNEKERALWAAFLIGFSTRHIPADSLLKAEQLRRVQIAVSEVHNIPPEVVPRGDGDDSISLGQHSLGGSTGTLPKPIFSQELHHLGGCRRDERGSDSKSDTDSGFLCTGTETILPPVRDGYASDISQGSKCHLFYRNPRDNLHTPPWFFDDISKEDAAEILEAGEQFGNILMRLSSTFKSTGMYIVTRRYEKTVGGDMTTANYEIHSTPGGFVLNVNKEFNSLPCLQDVMNYVLDIVGPDERLMSTNDLRQIRGRNQLKVGLEEVITDLDAPITHQRDQPLGALYLDMSRHVGNGVERNESIDYLPPSSPTSSNGASHVSGDPFELSGWSTSPPHKTMSPMIDLQLKKNDSFDIKISKNKVVFGAENSEKPCIEKEYIEVEPSDASKYKQIIDVVDQPETVAGTSSRPVRPAYSDHIIPRLAHLKASATNGDDSTRYKQTIDVNGGPELNAARNTIPVVNAEAEQSTANSNAEGISSIKKFRPPIMPRKK